ncbi:MAG: ATP-dependent RNA helicase dbp4, partial [Chaenotheca gracillima]
DDSNPPEPNSPNSEPETESESSEKESSESKDLDPDSSITWIHHHEWNSYPYLYPRVTFDDPELTPATGPHGGGLWYTAGIESFISTMETSSLMGMNVA